ncbi:MAG: dCTP deaminase [Candidatus Marinimicrobia bacterium]|nr:dCTP deaminase [Candidatus Neomarinimicrobiota bacterium]MCF7830003.1 dCTP deaminase [Candidatus Neomarinimicrobiota bacterium]MCF7881955.1 dCTP deaminase [Candidatus Neomarinimicrobiota bacterium]
MARNNTTLKDILQNIIHEETQFPEDRNVAFLTVNQIGRLTEPGALDFGGSEYTEAEVEWIVPEVRNEDDKYGWWELGEGSYRIQFNEGVEMPDDTGMLLQTWEKVRKNGVIHPTEVITRTRNPLSTHIYVGEAGIGIKENARLSEVRLL